MFLWCQINEYTRLFGTQEYHWNEIFAPSVSRKDYYNASVALCFLGENLVVKMQENKNDDDAIHRS